jgi:hypothetical protein
MMLDIMEIIWTSGTILFSSKFKQDEISTKISQRAKKNLNESQADLITAGKDNAKKGKGKKGNISIWNVKNGKTQKKFDPKKYKKVVDYGRTMNNLDRNTVIE